MSGGVFEPFEVEDSALLVQLLVQPAINYALVHNRVPLVRHISVTNHSDVPVERLEVRLEIVGPRGPIAAPWDRVVSVPVPSGKTVGWDDFAAIMPDLALLHGSNEAYPVDYRLTVSRPGAPDVLLVAPSLMLAHNEWFGHPALYDSLAAFVQPNTRAVDQILRAAAGILLSRTGSGSIEGYQAGAERAARIAGAIYEALRSHGISYQEMPASFERTGQKIRTTGALLDARLGNCLDLAVTYAACLEQAGLCPLIWLTTSHAFSGFLLEKERLGSITVDETNLLVSMVEAGKAVPVELTKLGPGSQSADFAAAVSLGLAHFRTGAHALEVAIDVSLAHRSGIRPLPSDEELVTAPPEPVGGETRLGSIDLPAGVARDRLGERISASEEILDQQDPSPARVRQWKKALLDLSLRNPLLNLPKRGKGIDLHVPTDALKDLDDLVHAGKRISIVPQDAISQLHELAGARRAQDLDPETLAHELRTEQRIYGAVVEQRYRNAMRALQRDARTMEQETGGNYLYLALGTLVHPKASGGEAHAPLFLLPVRIEGGVGLAPYKMVIDGSGTASPNHCLIEWLRVKHRVRIPELEQPLLDQYGIDIPATLAALRENLVANQLNYRIDETASLRLLQFATFQMWRDLTDHWQSFMDNPVVSHLVQRAGKDFSDPAGDETNPSVDESRLHLPIPADGSQMQAIVMAERGYSFVLEGPPGTGKSQTITNLITRAIESKRSVLFVAEKQAALDVVKRRLDQLGLAPFTLDLHGRKQSINAIRQQLRESMEQKDAGDDAAWQAAVTKYRAHLVPLVRYPERVHGPNAAKLSLWSAFKQTLIYGEGVTADVPIAHLNASAEVVDAVEQMLETLPAVAHAARLQPAHPWSLSELHSVADVSPDNAVAVAAELEQVRQALLSRPGLEAIVRGLPSPDSLARILPASRLARDGTLPDRETTHAARGPRWEAASAQTQDALASLWRSFATEFAAFRPELLTSPKLDGWSAAAKEASQRWVRKRKHLQLVADQVAPYQTAPLSLDLLEPTLARLVEARGLAAELHRQVKALGGLRLPPEWLPTTATAQVDLAVARQGTRISLDLLGALPTAWEYLQSEPPHEDLHLLERLATVWRDWYELLGTGNGSLALWAGEQGWYAAWQRDGATWLTGLRANGLLGIQRWANVLATTEVLTRSGLDQLRGQLLSGRIPADAAEVAYRRGVATAALTERSHAGDLTYFEPEMQDNAVAQYEGAAKRLREVLPDYLPSALVRQRGFDPLARRGRDVKFADELKRKRGGKSFRELFTEYPDIVLAVTPCVLVSPTSAANFLAPGAAVFDLVIFDEASQIRVAEAIGAMGRGRAAVIVGDSRQMPPTNIMRASHGEDEDQPEDDDPVPEDLDSILTEAVESGLPQRWLSWHYRSHDESLIAFSNRYYYDNKLSSLPSPGRSDTAGVVWRRVHGTYDRGGTRTNRVEATEVVDEIARRLRDPATAGESIGVVTFNIQQRDLILDLLEESADPLIRTRLSEDTAEPIFVKNLENVQGDERDAILFSLAFSTNPETGQLPLNFGPLSQTGGERRLNVAVTRARRLVTLFASFDPADIDLSRTSALGTQHLRAYCEMAAAGVDRLGDLAAVNASRTDEVRDQVADAIRGRGHEVVVGYGLSDFTVDIAVRTPGATRWQVAIIMDSPSWANRPTVSDRDGAPKLLGQLMRWPETLRFWLPAWVRDPESVLQTVDAAVARAAEREEVLAAERESHRAATLTRLSQDVQLIVATLEAPTAPVPEQAASLVIDAPVLGVDPGPTPPAISRRAVRDTQKSTGAQPFVPFVPRSVGAQSDLSSSRHSQRVQRLVRETIQAIVDAEGPVETHRLARLTLACFGFAKTHEERRLAVLDLVPQHQIRTHEVGAFAWPDRLRPESWREFRQQQASGGRTFDEIAPEEIGNAACFAARNRALGTDDLLRSTLELLGYHRKTEKIDRLLRFGIDLALKTGRLARDGNSRYRAQP